MSKEVKERFLFHYSSVKVQADSTLLAASLGRGVWRKPVGQDTWQRLGDGWDSDMHTNRLHLYDNRAYACTNKGLLQLAEDGSWRMTDLEVTCYQFLEFGRSALAGTAYGLWVRKHGMWEPASHAQSAVYDVLYVPEFIILALDDGIAVYDRYTCEWSEHKLETAITSLAVYHGFLLGTTEKGELLVGNKRGGFTKVNYPNLFVFSLVTRQGRVYACTDHGLFRIGRLYEDITLFSVKLGLPVTDADVDVHQLYMATLFQGVQTMPIG
ncbi:hypothetical protein B5M42_000995 [Paenibacillus athensensis]|uniref:Uncharacterized protein n=1 Tax=Paenibacillus athensensis TaxID=1967502 RepID=A0A4Y8Q703_9BACL|nr:hypothetical protein [Paenibacillus athensensis]MCD1257412.1 hypothetical protein [Paenibacillus athensensis]